MNTITIHVTAQHIANMGLFEGKFNDCMVARALYDAGFDCGVSSESIWFGYGVDLATPESLARRINAYDRRENVDPFNFDIFLLNDKPIAIGQPIDDETELLSEIEAMLAGECEVSR